MLNDNKVQISAMLLIVGLLGFASGPAAAAVRIEGQVQAGGGPLARSTVTLWAASAGEPKQLAQTRTRTDGRFELRAKETPDKDAVLYLIAKGGEPTVNKGSGDNPAIGLVTVLGNTPPTKVVINERTTVASVWTNPQFLNGTAIKGPALSLRIAAGNVPNFVDLETGGWGGAIQDPLNSGQTPSMANFATLADVLAGCATVVTVNACDKLFIAATPPKGGAPTDTLTAAQSIARYPWYQPGRLFALLDQFYPVPPVKMDGQPKPGRDYWELGKTTHAPRSICNFPRAIRLKLKNLSASSSSAPWAGRARCSTSLVISKAPSPRMVPDVTDRLENPSCPTCS